MATKQKKRRTRKKEGIKQLLYYEAIGLAIFALSIVTILKLGIVGNVLVLFLRFFFGQWYMVSLIGCISIAVYFMIKRKWPNLIYPKLLGIYLIYGAILMFSHISLFEALSKDGVFTSPSVIMNTKDLFLVEANGRVGSQDLGGGMIGAVLLATFYFLFAAKGAVLVGIIFILLGILLITGQPFSDLLTKIFSPITSFTKKQVLAFREDIREWRLKRRTKKAHRDEEREEAVEEEYEEEERSTHIPSKPIISNFEEVRQEVEVEEEPIRVTKVTSKQEVEEVVEQPTLPAMAFVDEENKDYKLPPMNLLKLPKNKRVSGENNRIYENARKLEKTFHSFGVKAKVTKVHMGPAVTKYEVYPDVGVKVSKIVSLSDDLALALAAKDIRMEAPIPGKSAIGIEVPNNNVATVTLREVLESKENNRPDEKLATCLGRDITGEAIFASLNKMPHLLVAGATGSGKSVCINGIITSILMRAKPHEVKMMMIDPKMVELNVYNGIPHLLAPVVTDPRKASQALKKVVSEMERRYELFAHSGTRNIEGYNDYVKQHNQHEEAKQPTLPYIVVIVDELADLMMVASSDVEDAITRLAQMARAAGIHLIIATQRPSVDVITGVIKANIPSRIAFSVSSQTDSRTILDMGGAEKLLGRGDMLFMPIGAPKPIRVQGAFLSDEEVENIVSYVISQQKAQYQAEMIPSEPKEGQMEVDDELYDQAVRLVKEMQTASVSMLQRRFRIGYTRAARLIDAMEAMGIVGPYEGSKPREVLITKDEEDKEI
ncbi:S-DNA-T family DNA segregation ATPase FtsK/SpoIIIE [Priestia taiwanensis]|uniref:DNA translocase FtsK n=1 Tax=Priestia taiwanensis TaxID=1347902 RepID=A0A917ARJ9_9BACI|nr:S-DNA-T family DNA segregation ATPase FtsK/SpoIIIE [Priestia taiwanensis]GGE65064.1 DNA translocase FtsK [Priestia taiwanensis]